MLLTDLTQLIGTDCGTIRTSPASSMFICLSVDRISLTSVDSTMGQASRTLTVTREDHALAFKVSQIVCLSLSNPFQASVNEGSLLEGFCSTFALGPSPNIFTTIRSRPTLYRLSS